MSKTRWSSRQFLLSSLRFRCWIGYLVSYSNIYARQLSYILKLLVCRWDCTNHNVTLCSAHTESVREGYSSVLESFHFLERLSLRSDGKNIWLISNNMRSSTVRLCREIKPPDQPYQPTKKKLTSSSAILEMHARHFYAALLSHNLRSVN